MDTTNSSWIANYCALELELTYPILHGLSGYWSGVIRSVELYRSDPRKFPVYEYQDFIVLSLIVKIVGHQTVWSTTPLLYDMTRVLHRGRALKYIHNQTPQLCLAAVQQNGMALSYVHTQTPEICMAAVKQNPKALQFVHEPTSEIIAAAHK